MLHCKKHIHVILSNGKKLELTQISGMVQLYINLVGQYEPI